MYRQYNKGFFASLFDFSFNYFITNRIIPVLYGISLGLIGIGSLILLGYGIYALSQGGPESAGGLVLILATPIIALFYIIYVRVLLEFLIVVFRIADHVRDIAAGGGFTSSTPPISSPPSNPSGWNQPAPQWQGGNPNQNPQQPYPNVASQPIAPPPPSQQPPSPGWRTPG